MDGLKARARLDASGEDERRHLAPVLPSLEGGPTQAEAWLERYRTVWTGDLSHIFDESRV